MTTNINLPLDDSLLAELDLRREDVPRVRWIRRAIEERLERENGAALDRITRPYRQSVPGPNVENIRSSAQAKNFKPYPKKAKP